VCLVVVIRKPQLTYFAVVIFLVRFGVTHHFLTVIWFASVWAIWKKKNNRIFQDTTSDSSTIVEKVKLNSFMWLKSSQTSFIYDYHDWWKNPLLCMGVIV
jgi:hypothetical protein